MGEGGGAGRGKGGGGEGGRGGGGEGGGHLFEPGAHKHFVCQPRFACAAAPPHRFINPPPGLVGRGAPLGERLAQYLHLLNVFQRLSTSGSKDVRFSSTSFNVFQQIKRKEPMVYLLLSLLKDVERR